MNALSWERWAPARGAGAAFVVLAAHRRRVASLARAPMIAAGESI